MIKLMIPDIPPSSNEFLGNSKSYHIYRNKKLIWEWLVKEAANKIVIEAPFIKSKVTIKYFFPDNRRRDPDNYAGKWLL